MKSNQAAPDLIEEGNGRFRVAGDIGFANVTQLLGESRVLFSHPADSLLVDLGGVGRADSAGLALLLEWMRLAQAAGKSIRYRQIPAQLLAIAHASNLDRHLPLTD